MDVLRERLAAYAHDEAWAHWMHYLFSECKPLVTMGDDSGALVIPGELVERWQRQAATRFASLPGAERESDRAQADKILAIVEGQVARMVTDAAGAEIAALTAELTEARKYLAASQASIEAQAAPAHQRDAEVAELRAQLAEVSSQLELKCLSHAVSTGTQLAAQEWRPVEPLGLSVEFLSKPFPVFVVPFEDRLVVVKAPDGGTTIVEHGSDFAFCRRTQPAEVQP